jgi:hypothetical protein
MNKKGRGGFKGNALIPSSRAKFETIQEETQEFETSRVLEDTVREYNQ